MIINADTDRFVREVIENNEYDFLFRNLVVVDIGCNVGTFSLWMNKLAKQIYAIDISQENIDNFDKTIADNKLTNIKTYCCGIAGNTRMRHYTPRGDAGIGGWAITNEEEAPEIQTYSLNDFMVKEGIDYIDVLKVDTEGLEQEILWASDFPKDKVGWIIGEEHGNSPVEGLLNMGYHTGEAGPNKFLLRK